MAAILPHGQVNSQLGEFTLKKHQMGMLDERFATHPGRRGAAFVNQ
jgi:hypothetical protein